MSLYKTTGFNTQLALKGLMVGGLMLILYLLSFDCEAALQEGDKVAELKTLADETQKIVKTGCYIAGSASALVGTIAAVASQNLKVAVSSGVITIVAFKATSFFSGTMLI